MIGGSALSPSFDTADISAYSEKLCALGDAGIALVQACHARRIPFVARGSGTSEGKPLTEIAPTAKGLTEQKNFWVEVKENSLIPGFADQLIGMKAGEKRTVNVDFPADFVAAALSAVSDEWHQSFVPSRSASAEGGLGGRSRRISSISTQRG